MAHHQTAANLKQRLTIVLGELVENGSACGVCQGSEDIVQDASIGKCSLACQEA